MKKLALFLFLIPALSYGQNITNTLGTGGKFIIEDNVAGTPDVVSINPTGPELLFGKQPTGFSNSLLPSGKFQFLSSGSSATMNIVSAGAGFSPMLNLNFANGDLGVSLTDVVVGDDLGGIGFGGRLTTWQVGAANITASVTSIANGSIGTDLTFKTQDDNATSNTMVFDDSGSLIVPASISSNAIRTINASTSATAQDQTIICTAAITVTLPSVSNLPVGKTYTLKKGTSANYSFAIDADGSESIDGSNANLSVGANNTYNYVTIQSDGLQWWVIGRGN